MSDVVERIYTSRASNRDEEVSRISDVVEEKTDRSDARLEVLEHWSWITIFSILGTLTRLGIQSLNTYPGQVIPNLVWAQVIGCAIIGFLSRDDHLFPKKSRYDALFIGLTVGYCGSVTSFSAWILATFEDLANTTNYRRSSGYNVISLLTQLMVTLTASLVAFTFGAHIHTALNNSVRLRRIPRMQSHLAPLLLVTIALLFIVGSILAAALRREWRGDVAFAMVFSPAGALSRWYLSKWFNKINPAFPLGTFAANIVGVLLEAIFHLLQYHVKGGNACAILQGLQDGYCGALSTVSTFILELHVLGLSHSYRYAASSIVIGIILYVLVDGIDYWTYGSSSYTPRCTYDTP